MKKFFKVTETNREHICQEGIYKAQIGDVVIIKDPTRSLDQNAKMWAMLTDVSTQVEWYGQYLTEEEWKDVFTAALKKQKVVPGIDGGFVVCGQRTSKMTKAEFSELIEFMLYFGAQKNVRWSAPQL